MSKEYASQEKRREKFSDSIRKSRNLNHNTGSGEDDELRYAEAARFLDVKLSSLYQYVTQGLLTPIKRPGHHPVFSRAYIMQEAARRMAWRQKRGVGQVIRIHKRTGAQEVDKENRGICSILVDMENVKPEKEVMREIDGGFKMAELDDMVVEELFGPVSVSHR